MQLQFSGKTSACHADVVGSIPTSCSFLDGSAIVSLHVEHVKCRFESYPGALCPWQPKGRGAFIVRLVFACTGVYVSSILAIGTCRHKQQYLLWKKSPRVVGSSPILPKGRQLKWESSRSSVVSSFSFIAFATQKYAAYLYIMEENDEGSSLQWHT